MPNNALILARDKNNVIAVNGKEPWNCPKYNRHFANISKDFEYTIPVVSDDLIKLLDSSAYCLIHGGGKDILNYLDRIDSVFLFTIKGIHYDSTAKAGNVLTYFTHNFKKGQYTSEDYNNPKKNKFDLEISINYVPYKLEVWERKEPYFAKENPWDNGLCRDRQCLNCKTSFLSTWSGNRICNVCKNSWDWIHNADLGDETYIPEGE